jgi:hypothetical protein
MDWSWPDVADALVSGLARAADAIELEQAVSGLDALSELELHPILQGALRDSGHLVLLPAGVAALDDDNAGAAASIEIQVVAQWHRFAHCIGTYNRTGQ